MDNLLRNTYNNLTLKNKILILNAIVIICSFTIFAYFASSISGDAILEKTQKSSARELELIDSNLDTIIRGMEDYSKVIASNDKLQEKMMEWNDRADKGENIDVVQIKLEISRILRNIISPNTRIIASNIYIKNKMIYTDINVDDYSSESIITGEYLNAAYEYQKPLWSDLLVLALSDGSKENVFAVAKLVIDIDSGIKTGTIVLYVSEKDISGIYSENSPNINNRYYILNSDNLVISSADKTELNKNAMDIISINKNQLAELERNGRLIAEMDNKSLLFSIQNFDKLGWKIISMSPLDEIAQERSNLRKVIFIASTVCFLLAFIFSYLISYTVTKPVQRLSKTMKLIMKGDMNVRAEEGNNSDIGVLTRGFNNLMDRIQELMEDIVRDQKIKQEFEFKLIQSQIKPHFLYNSLETIISLNKLERHEEAMKVTKSLAGFYRLSLSKGNDIIKIGEEILIITDYLYIQRMRYSNYMDFTVDVDEKIRDYYIPKLTLQPLVENSIYHGLKCKNNKGRVEIKGFMEFGKIALTVYDDGAGIPEEKINILLGNQASTERKEDFGLGSVDKRIKLLYGNEYGLQIKSETGCYTKVSVIIPIVKGGELQC